MGDNVDVRLVAGASWRYPGAEPVQLDGLGWGVALRGPAEEVVSAGVYKSDEVGNEPLRLVTTTHDAYQSLDVISQIDDDEAGSALLARHAQAHPVSRLLCKHGKPMWHHDRGVDTGCGQHLDGAAAFIAIEHVRTMMNGFRGLEELAYHVATRRRPARPSHVTTALQWQLMPDYLDEIARAETERDGALFLGRCKQIVAMSLQILQEEALLSYKIEWIKDQRLQLVAHANTDLALYVYDFTSRVLDAANANDVDLTSVCQHCRQPYQPRSHPKPGSAFCSKTDCQRARKRQNQRMSRRRRTLL